MRVEAAALAKRLVVAAPCELDEELVRSLHAPFAVLLAPGSAPEMDLELVAARLLAAGCRYFVCSGSNSEAVHDRIDDVILEEGTSNVTTTFHDGESMEDVAEFFLTCAASDMDSLLVVAEPDSSVQCAIREALASRARPR